MPDTMTRDDILKISDTAVMELVVPEWNDKTVFIRTLSGHERDKLSGMARRMIGGSDADLLAWYAVYSLSDRDGNKILRDGDVHEVAKRNGCALSRIRDASIEWSHIGEDAVDDAEKNSETTPSDKPGTD